MEAALAGPGALEALAALLADDVGPHYGDRLEEPLCRIPCDCGELVVLVRLRDRGVVALDAQEVMPTSPCPLCRLIERRGHNRGGWCWRCGGTGVVGEQLPEPAVAVLGNGNARIFRGRRFVGESVHRLHLCGARR